MVIRFFSVRQQVDGAVRSLAAPSSTARQYNAKQGMRLHSIALGVLCVLALSACGGGGGGSTSPNTPSTSGASPSSVPTITAQPLSQAAVAGAAVTFTVSATGDALSYQWQDSANAGVTWTDIVGATSAGYTVSSVSGAMNGRMYRAGISTGGTTVYSSAATLTVAQATAPGISVQPTDVSAIAGNAADISVTASGTSLQYQWQVSSDGTTWQNIASATSALLHLASLATSDSGKHYRVIVSNTLGSVTSNPVVLTISAPPAQPGITSQPAAMSVITGQAATFSVTAAGNPAPSYQWQLSSDGGVSYTNISGATGSSYTLASTVAGDNGKRYRVMVSNSQGTATSSAVLLTVNAGAAPGVVTDAREVIANYPDNDFGAARTGTFSVVATGTPTPNYQWQVSTDAGQSYTNINGATASSYTTPPVSKADDSKLFRAVISNVLGTVTSHPARLDAVDVGLGGTTIDGVQGMVIRPNGDITVTVGSSGSLCTLSCLPMVLRTLTHTGSVTSFGSPNGSTVDVDGTGNAAVFYSPQGIAQDTAGNLYVSDLGNRIRKITPTGVVTTLAGGDAKGGYVNGQGALASFKNPGALAIDKDGNVYVLDTGNKVIRKVTPTGVVTTFAGGLVSNRKPSVPPADGTGASAEFGGFEVGIAYDQTNNQLIVVDSNYCTVRKVSMNAEVTTLTKDTSRCIRADGPLASAGFAGMSAVAVDASGNIFVAEGQVYVRKITPAGDVSTIYENHVASVGTAAITTDAVGNAYLTRHTSIYFGPSMFGESYLITKITPGGTVTTLP